MTERKGIQLPNQIIKKAGEAIEEIRDIQPEDALTAAMKIPLAKVSRDKFLRKELIKYYPEEVVQLAIDKNPAYAGIPRWSVNKIAKEVISYETNKVSGLSFFAGLPGGVAMIGTIPADFAQYFGFMLRVMQNWLIYMALMNLNSMRSRSATGL